MAPGMIKEYVLASDNPGKLGEMAAMFGPLGFVVHPQSDFQVPPGVAETGSTFIENALIKARHAAEHTTMACIADDSGLVVPALQGAPGIYSARYAGPQADSETNMKKLLEALTGLDGEDRSAHFYCAMVCIESAGDPAPLVATGVWHGHILASPQGDDGFGYDPVFAVTALDAPGPQQSAAEISAAEKARHSHRGQALRKLVKLVHAMYDG